MATASLLAAGVVVQSAETAHLVGRTPVLSGVTDLLGLTTAVAATGTSSTRFVAGTGASSARSGTVASITRSTAAAQKQAAAFPAFGMSQGFQPIELSDDRLASMFAGIRATGVRSVRLDLPWQQIQPASRTSYDFSNVRRVYRAALSAGLDVLPVSTGMPAWAGTTAPRSTKYYYDFLHHAGRALIPLGIRTIEIGNEVNISGMSPARYTKYVLVPGAKGFRTAGVEKKKTVTIVSTGLAPAATSGGNYSQLAFLKGIYAAGGRAYFDAVGLHPYTWPLDPGIDVSWNWLKKATSLRALMVAKGDSGKQIWATEFGFPTNTGARGIDEEHQADYLVEGARIWASYPWAGPLIFYSYRDLTATDADPEHNFGLRRSDGSEKPSLRAVEGLVDGR